MPLLDLPEEILSSIVSVVYQSPPGVGVYCTRKDFHQQDLTSLLRVNKRLFHLTSNILYIHPIVDDPHQFLYGIDKSPEKAISKANVLRNVKYLDIQHKQSTRDKYEEQNTYNRLKSAEREIWEDNVLGKSKDDIENCEKAFELLNRLVSKAIFNDFSDFVMPNLDTLRVGVYDQGWWVDKMKKIMFDNKYPESRSIPHSASSRNLLDEIQIELEISYQFQRLFLALVKPKTLIRNLTAGPLSFNLPFNAQEDVLLCPPKQVINYLNYNIDRRTFKSHPVIIPYTINKWYIQCKHKPRVIQADEEEEDIYIDYEGLMVSLEILLQHISSFKLPITNHNDNYREIEETILEVYDIDKLEYKEYGEAGKVKLVAGDQWIGDSEDHLMDSKQHFPTRISSKLTSLPLKRKRFGPWGMMELTPQGLAFVDIKIEDPLKFTVLIKNTSSEYI
ncbi:uncharacterized protein L201_000169 [Kwoniella dendrophila CBS 6074]|uniref:F-box domain-containing protein n=1 Tax=Kwoniella dendrophila CBS 6074 TaxID=1295534 RepID=A0AAX4JIK8_9TREE